MSDPGFVAAAYAIVLGGLGLYVLSIARRVRVARRTAQALDQARERNASEDASESPPLMPRPSEPTR
jgi:hypothetical protein